LLPRPFFQKANKFGNTALERGLLFDRNQVADDLSSQGCGHAAEGCLRARRVSQRENQKRRQDRFARIFITLDGDFDGGAGVDSQFLADVAVDGDAVASLAARNHGGAQGNSVNRAANRNVRCACGHFSRDFGRNVDVANQANFVNPAGENMKRIFHGRNDTASDWRSDAIPLGNMNSL
jgi:hypothetical protein